MRILKLVEVVILIKHQILVRNLQGIMQQPKGKIINHFGILRFYNPKGTLSLIEGILLNHSEFFSSYNSS